MFTDDQRAFLDSQRVAHLGTVAPDGSPHVVPVCYAMDATSLYITIDQKPKRTDRRLRRISNIIANPAVSVTVDRYEEDWTRLAWVMLRGRADILDDGAEHTAAQRLLATRYPQLAAMRIAGLPVIALRIATVTSWGALRPV